MCTQSMTNCCSVTPMSVKAQRGFIDTNVHPFSVLLQFKLWSRKTLLQRNMNGTYQGIWYCCQVNKCCSVTHKQLHHAQKHHVYHLNGYPHTRDFIGAMSSLFSYCPWHTYMAACCTPPCLPPYDSGSSSACILHQGLAGTCLPTAFGWSHAQNQLWPVTGLIKLYKCSDLSRTHTDNASLVLLSLQRLWRLWQTQIR